MKIKNYHADCHNTRFYSKMEVDMRCVICGLIKMGARTKTVRERARKRLVESSIIRDDGKEDCFKNRAVIKLHRQCQRSYNDVADNLRKKEELIKLNSEDWRKLVTVIKNKGEHKARKKPKAVSVSSVDLSSGNDLMKKTAMEESEPQANSSRVFISEESNMEVDIKLEEHVDVLDDPRNGYLSDLSCIKTEIPEEQSRDSVKNNKSHPDTEPVKQYEQQRPDYEIISGSELSDSLHTTVYQDSIKKETADVKENYVDTPLDICEYFPSDVNFETCASVTVPSEYNYIKNDSSVLIETVNEISDAESRKIKTPYVCLEDCGPRLQNSLYFCRECGILFSTYANLLVHNMSAHPILENNTTNELCSINKSSGRKISHELFCNHCNIKFPNVGALISHGHLHEGYQKTFPSLETWTSVIEKVRKKPLFCCKVCFYYSRIPSNMISHMSSNHSMEIEDGYITSYFIPKCKFCMTAYRNISVYNKHIEKRHRDMFFKKVGVLNKNIFKTPQVELSPDPSMIPRGLVSKSLLFECKYCDLNFFTCTAANMHANDCQRSVGDWLCLICKRSFKSQYTKIHLLQHKVSSEKFKVYLTGDHTLARILDKCPDCNAYFHEASFALHWRTACKGEPATCTKCALCELDIHSSSIEEHKKWHSKFKLNDKNAFVIVEFAKI